MLFIFSVCLYVQCCSCLYPIDKLHLTLDMCLHIPILFCGFFLLTVKVDKAKQMVVVDEEYEVRSGFLCHMSCSVSLIQCYFRLTHLCLYLHIATIGIKLDEQAMLSYA